MHVVWGIDLLILFIVSFHNSIIYSIIMSVFSGGSEGQPFLWILCQDGHHCFPVDTSISHFGYNVV